MAIVPTIELCKYAQVQMKNRHARNSHGQIHFQIVIVVTRRNTTLRTKEGLRYKKINSRGTNDILNVIYPPFG